MAWRPDRSSFGGYSCWSKMRGKTQHPHQARTATILLVCDFPTGGAVSGGESWRGNLLTDNREKRGEEAGLFVHVLRWIADVSYLLRGVC